MVSSGLADLLMDTLSRAMNSNARNPARAYPMPGGTSRPARDGGHPLDPMGAFVVQFRAGPMPDPDRHPGRVEHVASGEAFQFASSVELLDFIRARLRSGPTR